jgi:hypothetical protein
MTTDNILDSILDTVLDDIADLPSFKPFTPGVHRVSAVFTVEKLGTHPACKLTLTHIETIEQADPSADSSKAGDTCNSAYFLDNEIGAGKLKAISVAFAVALGKDSVTIRDLVEAGPMECLAVTNVRFDKNDKTKSYLDVIDLQVI